MTAYEQFKQQRFFGSLNGLRFIAIIAVLWHHSAASSFGITLAHRGPEGVTLFFAISGFLITTLLLREKSRTHNIGMKKFYIRRTLRIFPLYYTVLAAYVVLVYFTAEPARFENFFTNFLSFATYTSNFFSVDVVGGTLFSFAWSLAAEEQFYMIWPWVEKYLSNAMAVVVMLSVVLFIYHVRATGFEPHSVGGIIVFRIMPAICFGVLAAHALDNKRAFTALYSIVGGRYASLILLIGVIGYLSLKNNNFLLTHFLMAMLVTSCVIREDHLLNSLLRTRLLVVGGTISYGMYLMHMLTMHLVEAILHKIGTDNLLLVFIGTAVSSMALAFISYRYYESYFLNLKRKFKTTAPHPAGANALLK
jgi:peptidoglycan/LPS O-acetylase OafA/YrhL